MRAILVGFFALLMLTGCSEVQDRVQQEASAAAQQAFVSAARGATGGALDNYTDEQILGFGEQVCDKVRDVGGNINTQQAQEELAALAPEGVSAGQWKAITDSASRVLCTEN